MVSRVINEVSKDGYTTQETSRCGRSLVVVDDGGCALCDKYGKMYFENFYRGDTSMKVKVANIQCRQCGKEMDIRTYRKFVACPACGGKSDFPGFDYDEIDWTASMYANVKVWMDCPACRSKNMYLGAEGRKWLCPDCGYMLAEKDREKTVFWFCDECETYLNVQDGFSTKSGTWVCTECGCRCGVTREDII